MKNILKLKKKAHQFYELLVLNFINLVCQRLGKSDLISDMSTIYCKRNLVYLMQATFSIVQRESNLRRNLNNTTFQELAKKYMTDSLKIHNPEKNKGKPKIIEIRPFKLSILENFDLTDEQQQNLDRILKSFYKCFMMISKVDLLKVKKLKIL